MLVTPPLLFPEVQEVGSRGSVKSCCSIPPLFWRFIKQLLTTIPELSLWEDLDMKELTRAFQDGRF